MGQKIRDRQLKVLEECRAADRKIEAENRLRVKVGDIVKTNGGSWGAPKAQTCIVVRTYKAPDDDTILALPSSAETYEAVKAAIADGAMASINPRVVYSQCRTLSASEWRL